MLPLCRSEGLGVIPWSPLARGLLTGGRTGVTSKATARADSDDYSRQLYDDALDLPVAEQCTNLARERGIAFDAVQMPLNVMDAHYRSFEKLVLPELVKQNIGVLAMKTLANGFILKSKAVNAIECLQYAMNLPTSVVITGCESMENLEQALIAARTFKPMSDDEVSNLLTRTAKSASRGEYELFKTTSIYDGTAVHPEWLGEEPPEVKQVIQTDRDPAEWQSRI